MSPKQEWEYEQKLDHLSYPLEELIIEMFMNALQKFKDRNEPLAESKAKSLEDEIPFYTFRPGF